MAGVHMCTYCQAECLLSGRNELKVLTSAAVPCDRQSWHNNPDTSSALQVCTPGTTLQRSIKSAIQAHTVCHSIFKAVPLWQQKCDPALQAVLHVIKVSSACCCDWLFWCYRAVDRQTLQKTVTYLILCSECHPGYAVAELQVLPVVLKQQQKQQLEASTSESLQQGWISQSSSLQPSAVKYTVSSNELCNCDIMINNAATMCQHNNKCNSPNHSAFQASQQAADSRTLSSHT